MTRNTMTGWIEIADERQFCESTMPDQMPKPDERQHLHLGSAIFTLPCRIIGALTHRRPEEGARLSPALPPPAGRR